MLFFRASFAAIVSAMLVAPPAFASHIHRPPTSGQAHHSHRFIHHRRHVSDRVRGQQSIQPERVTQIQQALINAHYLTGDPTGKWDQTTITAMQKFQADHGWQTKIMPDSRALEKLGLGPDYSDALNAKNLSLATPTTGAPIPADQVAGFQTASGVSQ